MESEGDLTAALAALTAEGRAPDAVEVFAVTLNGVARGKRVPMASVEKLAAEGPGSLRFQTSLMGLDIFGADVAASRIAMEIGDPDGVFVPLAHTLTPLPFRKGMATLQGMLADPASGALCAFDPRAVLLRVVDRAAAMGLAPVIALEIEFYLIDPETPLPARHPVTRERLAGYQVMDLDVLDAFAPVIADMEAAARTLGARTLSVLSEFGHGQFEINLAHMDAARACDALIALKKAVRAAARHHGLDATFMAKPFAGAAGSGMHIHLSLADGAADGANAFDAPGSPLGDTLSFAVGGAQASAAETFLISAPNLNSYRRFRAGSYAPIAATWGLDNRGAAVRVPSTCGPSARLENRIAGADANPYLVAAAVIAGALSGIARRQRPGPPSIDDCGEGPSFARNMEEALDVFARSEFVADWLGEEFRRVFSAIKAQEIDKIGARVSDVEHELYLRVV